MTKANEIETAKVKQFSARIMEDYGNTLRGAMLYIGDRLGLFKALAHGQWVTLEELAQQTGYTTRYLREWLGSMVTGNYLAYDPQSRSYRLPAEFVPVLADEDSPYFAGGIIQLSVPFVSMAPKIIEAFRCGGGCPEESFPLETWEGMERMTMPGTSTSSCSTGFLRWMASRKSSRRVAACSISAAAAGWPRS